MSTSTASSTASYWNGTGRYQQDSESLFALLPVATLADIPRLAIFNGIAGIYYAHHNDGDDVDGAIDNNRVHGFNTREAFQQYCDDHDAPKEICDFLEDVDKNLFDNSADSIAYDNRLESVMDAAISFAIACLPLPAKDAPIVDDDGVTVPPDSPLPPFRLITSYEPYEPESPPPSRLRSPPMEDPPKLKSKRRRQADDNVE